MTKHTVVLVLKNGSQLSFPHDSAESGAETIKVFYEALGPLRPVTRFGVVHQDSVVLLYCCKVDVDENAEDKKAVQKVTTVEQMIRDFFRR